jgi:hypothetical protein
MMHTKQPIYFGTPSSPEQICFSTLSEPESWENMMWIDEIHQWPPVPDPPVAEVPLLAVAPFLPLAWLIERRRRVGGL